MMVKRTLSVCTGQGKRQGGIVKYVFFGVHAEFLLNREWEMSLFVSLDANQVISGHSVI
jgi:hypothetical protein